MFMYHCSLGVHKPYICSCTIFYILDLSLYLTEYLIIVHVFVMFHHVFRKRYVADYCLIIIYVTSMLYWLFGMYIYIVKPKNCVTLMALTECLKIYRGSVLHLLNLTFDGPFSDLSFAGGGGGPKCPPSFCLWKNEEKKKHPCCILFFYVCLGGFFTSLVVGGGGGASKCPPYFYLWKY